MAETNKSETKKPEIKKPEACMRMKSTGLGTTMLYAEVDKVDVVDDTLILHINSVSPVRWHIRAGITYKGMLELLWAVFKSFIAVKFVFLGFTKLKNPKLPEDF
ncbi:MAG: hypothetical protein FP814_13375 [Desulfobacterium sp.]|nr:hypothetical protein [Desulfobacterium sp.]